MDQPYIGAIFIWAGTFAPRGYAFCNGQILSIAQNQALFSILGTTYGGNGTTTFALPNLCGRAPFGAGVPAQGTGLTTLTLGEVGGNESITLTQNNMPLHNHTAAFTSTSGGSADIAIPAVAGSNATTNTPGSTTVLSKGVTADRESTPINVYSAATADTTLKPFPASVSGGSGNVTVNAAGGSQPFNIHPPYLALNFIIALEGIYPPRN
jgi:microcystin-dependent protein